MARDLYIRSGKQGGELSSSVLIAAEIMDESGSTDEQVSRRLAVAASVVKSMSTHPLLAFDLFAMRDEGILYRFVIKGSIDRLMEIDSAIDDALFSEFDEELDDILSIGVAPFELGSQIMASDGYHVSVL